MVAEVVVTLLTLTPLITGAGRMVENVEFADTPAVPAEFVETKS